VQHELDTGVCGVGCRNGVIDSFHIPVWQNILAQQRELLFNEADCGASGSRRVSSMAGQGASPKSAAG
jgi:hypothetical protein